MRVSTSQFNLASARSITQQQALLSEAQQRLATGRRVLTPADDPAAASRGLELRGAIGQIEQLQKNSQLAESRLSGEENALVQVGNVLQRIRELALQANNGVMDSQNRRLIAAEMRERLGQLVQQANAEDGNGEYLFAGFESKQQPFAQQGGQVSYSGDQGQRFAQISPSRQIATNHNGFEVFMAIKTGNGEFATVADPTNNGTGIINQGTVQDATITPDYPYSIDFATNINGDMEYTVTDGGGAVIVPATAFVEGDAIQFDGREVVITGEPADGDAFTVEASRNRSMFETVQNLIDALETGSEGVPDNARFNNRVNQALGEIDNNIENLLTVRAEVGARLNAIDTERDSNETALLELKSSLSETEDLDYAKAITELNQRLTSLEAAQQSYVKIQGLTLFNYIS